MQIIYVTTPAEDAALEHMAANLTKADPERFPNMTASAYAELRIRELIAGYVSHKQNADREALAKELEGVSVDELRAIAAEHRARG